MSNKLIINKHLLNEIILEECKLLILEENIDIYFEKNKKKLQEIIKIYDNKILLNEESAILDILQLTLMVVGMCPPAICVGIGEVADAIDALISFARGNIIDGVLALVGIIPGLGDIIAKPIRVIIKLKKAFPPKLIKLFMENVPKITNFITNDFPKLLKKVPIFIEKIPMLSKSKKNKIIQSISEMSSRFMPIIQKGLAELSQMITGNSDEIAKKIGNAAANKLTKMSKNRRQKRMRGMGINYTTNNNQMEPEPT